MAPKKDPDKRRNCHLCGGPIYIDEPKGCICIECIRIQEAKERLDRTDHNNEPRTCKDPKFPLPRQRGFGRKDQ